MFFCEHNHSIIANVPAKLFLHRLINIRTLTPAAKIMRKGAGQNETDLPELLDNKKTPKNLDFSGFVSILYDLFREDYLFEN